MYRVRGRNVNTSVLIRKQTRDQGGSHNPTEGRPKAPERGKAEIDAWYS